MRTALVAALAAFVLALPAARADIPPRPRPNPVPRPQPPRPAAPPAAAIKFTVEVDDKAKGPRLIVPQNLNGVRLQPRPTAPAPAGPAGNEPVAYLEFESDDEAAP